MNARKKAKKYKRELDILKQSPMLTPKVFYSVGDVVTYQTEFIIPIHDIFDYTDKVICNMIIDKFKDAIKDNVEFIVEDCLYGKRIIAYLRLVKPRRVNENITL